MTNTIGPEPAMGADMTPAGAVTTPTGAVTAPTSAVAAARPAGLALRTRWLIGGGIATVAIVVAAGAALVLSARPVPEAEKYVPGNAVVVAELRLDLPGDQFQKVGNLLAHFPGFADQSTLSAKLSESLDRLTKAATNGSADYTTNLQPWLTGPTFVGILPPAASAAASAAPSSTPLGASSETSGDATDGVVIATTDGKVTCASVITGGTSEAIPQGSLLVTGSGDEACFIDGKFGLIGTPGGVKAALAAHAGGTGIDHDAQYSVARNTLGGDRLATLYVAKAAGQLMQSAEASLPPSFPIAVPAASGFLPDWLIAGVRAEDDALVTDVLVAPGAVGTNGTAAPLLTQLPTLPPPHESQIAGFIPGNAILLAETHGAGVTAANAIAALRSDPQFQAEASQLDAALGLAGGPEGVVGWISDVGVVVLPQGTAPAAGAGPGVDAGLVLVATDEATASTKEQQLKSLLSVLALSAGGNVDDQSVGGATVTTIDLGDLSTLIGSSGASSQLGGVTIPAGVHVKLTLAVRGKLVLLGGDDGFARDVLGVQAGLTLADDAVYKRALALGAASNLGQIYVAGGSARGLASKLIPASQQASWQEILPYANPLDAVLLTTTLENGIAHAKLVVAVSTPPASASTGP